MSLKIQWDDQKQVFTSIVSDEDDSQLKKNIISYVGNKVNPDDGNVSLEMVLQALAEGFPEIVLSLAEENYLRGYEQALCDVETFEEKDVVT